MNPYVLSLESSDDLVQEFRKIGVDAGGVDIMRRKGLCRVVKLHGIASFVANILKQEMLSLGADVALSRWSLTGRDKKTDCLILGNMSQFVNLARKLKKQPFGLEKIGAEISDVLKNYDRVRKVWDVGGKKISFGQRSLLMGIVNATPDSFSGDGVLGMDARRIRLLAQDMVKNGADILDIGGESSRPGAGRVSAKEESRRVLAVLKAFGGKLRVPLSVDTTKSEVAHAALERGVSIVNDVSALRADRKMARLIVRHKASVVLMHRKGSSKTMQKKPHYDDMMGEIVLFLREALARALDQGIPEEKIILDPGIGFGKTVDHNLEILEKLSCLRSLGRPILVGLSRKWFIGQVLGADVNHRVWGGVAAMSLAIAHGADIVRVHDVKEMKQAAKMADAILRRRGVLC